MAADRVVEPQAAAVDLRVCVVTYLRRAGPRCSPPCKQRRGYWVDARPPPSPTRRTKHRREQSHTRRTRPRVPPPRDPGYPSPAVALVAAAPLQPEVWRDPRNPHPDLRTHPDKGLITLSKSEYKIKTDMFSLYFLCSINFCVGTQIKRNFFVFIFAQCE